MVASSMACLIWASVAMGGAYFIEGPPVKSRAEATAMVQVISVGGEDARVVHRFRQGQGWQYVFVIDGFDDRAMAVEVAEKVARETGRGILVYSDKRHAVKKVEVTASEVVNAPEGVNAPDAVNTPELAEWPISVVPPVSITQGEQASDALISRILRAHRAKSEGTTADYVFTFVREGLSLGTVSHVLASKGDSRVLQVTVSGASAHSSRLLLLSDRAWLTVDNGEPIAADVERVRATIARFSPERVLSLPFRLETERELLSQLHLAGETTVEGAACLVLAFEGDRLSDPLFLAVDKKTYLLRQLALGSPEGAVLQTFSNYLTTSSGRKLPSKVETWSGGELVDTVKLTALEAINEAVEGWFAPPK